VKFASKDDIMMFLVEAERMDLMSEISAGKDFKPTAELVEMVIRKRRLFIPKLVDFRRSQVTKAEWRKFRYKIMKGIKRFHRSTAGKRFHRSLARFIATRQFYRSDSLVGNKNESVDIVLDTLKAIASAKTHLLIESHFYMSVDVYVDYFIFYEDAYAALSSIEQKVYAFDENIDKDDVELLTRMVERKYLISEIADAKSRKFENVLRQFEEILAKRNEDEPCYVDAVKMIVG